MNIDSSCESVEKHIYALSSSNESSGNVVKGATDSGVESLSIIFQVFYILVTVRNHLCLNFANMKYRTIQVRLVLCVSLVGLIASQADQASSWNVRQKNTIHVLIILLYGLSQWMKSLCSTRY